MKYTIIIPTYNGLKYLKDAIKTVTSQDYDDYELIISDNHSDDGTVDYLATIEHKNIKKIKPENKLAVAEHWEYALSYAQGDWIIFVGVDDGLQPYFFRLSDYLVKEAEKNNIKAINSRRGYYFWEGCQETYGDISINYNADAVYTIKDSKKAIEEALIGKINYVDIPHMYTESIIHKDIIKEVKDKQNGLFYVSMTQDCNGAVAICSSIDKYIQCETPLGIVGSSGSSIGLNTNSEKNNMKYVLDNMNSNRITWSNELISFGYLHISRVYFYDSILKTKALQSKKQIKKYNSKYFKKLFFANVYKDIVKIKNNEMFVERFKEVLEINNLQLKTINFYRKSFLRLHQNDFLCSRYLKPSTYIRKIKKEICKLFKVEINETHKNSICCFEKYSETTTKNIFDVWNIINKMDVDSSFIDNFIKG